MDMGSAPIEDPTVGKSHRSVRSESPEFNEQGSSDSDVNPPKNFIRKITSTRNTVTRSFLAEPLNIF